MHGGCSSAARRQNEGRKFVLALLLPIPSFPPKERRPLKHFRLHFCCCRCFCCRCCSSCDCGSLLAQQEWRIARQQRLHLGHCKVCCLNKQRRGDNRSRRPRCRDRCGCFSHPCWGCLWRRHCCCCCCHCRRRHRQCWCRFGECCLHWWYYCLCRCRRHHWWTR